MSSLHEVNVRPRQRLQVGKVYLRTRAGRTAARLFLAGCSGKLLGMATPMGQRSAFWEKHRRLVWSNPHADDSVHIRAALVRPRFGQLQEIVMEFGLERVSAEWELLKGEATHEAERAQPIVDRILKNIEEGFRIAAAGN